MSTDDLQPFLKDKLVAEVIRALSYSNEDPLSPKDACYLTTRLLEDKEPNHAFQSEIFTDLEIFYWTMITYVKSSFYYQFLWNAHLELDIHLARMYFVKQHLPLSYKTKVNPLILRIVTGYYDSEIRSISSDDDLKRFLDKK